MITIAANIWNITLLSISHRIINVRLMGVAKNLFNTKVVRKLKNIKAIPKTPDDNNANPNCPGRMKSMDLYFRITAISLGKLKSKSAYTSLPGYILLLTLLITLSTSVINCGHLSLLAVVLFIVKI